ncbi:hypothetical protein CTS44_18372 [Comamonas thiooxydans]|nr:hypothetical protein CTS44_18372 [Comamonas thiooxydans]
MPCNAPLRIDNAPQSTIAASPIRRGAQLRADSTNKVQNTCGGLPAGWQ